METELSKLISAPLIIVLLLIAVARGAHPSSAEVDFRVLIQQHVDALNRGDVTGVMATFSDDAVITTPGAGLCAAPCVGKAAIQRDIERRVAIHVRFTITSLQENSGSGTGRVTITSDNTRTCSVDRIVESFSVTVKNDRIMSFATRFDESDVQTATYIGCLAAPAGVPAVTPPRTGDGGLVIDLQR